jgi:D-arginine dehydrogenase
VAETSDILVIGGGVAGLSAAAVLSENARVTVLEAEEQIGFHASGRSATLLHYALGDRLVRALTLASRPFFDDPPEEFGGALAFPMPVLVHARAEERAALDVLADDIAPFAKLERLDAAGLAYWCPVLRTGTGASEHGLVDAHGLKLDGHALLQGYARRLQHHGGDVRTGARVAAIERDGKDWAVATERGDCFLSPIIVNAAGAWADAIARLAGVAPIELVPKRRTIIVFDAPAGLDLQRLPFAKTVGDELYFGREGGRVFASPMDEVPTDPSDAQAEEYEMALAAFRVEEQTTMTVGRIAHRWAGLRTFTPDRRPAVGFAPDVEGFFWLAGQGGFGLQTSPVMARIAASLIAGAAWPLAEVLQAELSPDRFLR